MKTILLLLVAVSWAAAEWSSDTVKVFSPEREYRYEYESQILTGIPTLNSQYSGLKVKARAVMHIATDNYVTLKLTNIEIHSVREEPGIVPTTWIPPSFLEPIPSEHNTELIESLVKPIKFRYETGLVTKLYTESSDPYWSVNIKRGILSMVNLDLNAENPVPVESTMSKSFMNMIRPDYNVMTTKSAYKVIEPSVMGDCETLYSLVPIPSASKMIVSKVVDTKRCSPKVMAESGIFPGMIPTDELKGLTYPSITYDYVLSGSRHEFLINSAVLTGKYTISPASAEVASTVNGYVIQKLTYIKDEPIDRPITFESTPIPMKKGLHAYIPLQGLITKEVFGTSRMGEDSLEAAKIQMVDDLLEAIVEKTAVKASKEVPDMVATLTMILKKLSKPEIVEIISRHFSSQATGPGAIIAKKRSVIIDVLSTLSHPEAPIILVEMAKKDYFGCEYYADIAIWTSAMTVPPSPALINTLVQMAKDPVIKSKTHVYRSVMLGAGLLADKLVKLHIKSGIPQITTASIIKGVVKEIKTMLDTVDITEKITVIKTIGNTGIVDFIPDIERIVKDKSLSPFVRKEAITALRKMALIAPTAIQSIALPVYLDVKESEDVRVAAAIMIMETRPPFAVVHMIGHSINYEPNVQIAAFTYRYLQNIARATNPVLRPISVIAKRVLLTVRPIVISPLLNSNAYRWESFCSYANVSTALNVERIQSRSRSIPHSILSKQNGYINGKPINIYRGDLEMRGLDDIIRRLVGTEGILGEIMSGRADISQIFDPLTAPDMGVVGDEIRSIISQTDLPEPIKDVFRLYSNWEILGHEVAYFDTKKEHIIKVLEAVKSSSIELAEVLIRGYDIDVVKTLPLMDESIVVPTPMGLPICVNVSAISVIAIKGNIKLDGISSISALLSNPSKVEIATKIRPSMHTDIYQIVSIQHDILSVGTAIKGHISADVPISASATIDIAMEKVILKMDVPKAIPTSISAAVKPMMFKHFVPLKASAYSASMYDIHLPKTVPIFCEKVTKPVPITAEYTIPVLSTKVKVEGIISYPVLPIVSPILIALSKHELSVIIEPTSSTPEAVVIELIYGEKKAIVKRAESSNSWFGWFSDEEPVAVEEIVDTEEFIPVVISPAIANPTKTQIFVNIKTIGGYNDAKIKSKLTWITNPSKAVHQINCQAVGSSIITRLWKTRIDTVIDITKLLETVIVAPKEPSSEIIAISEISFGIDRFTDNAIIVKVLPVKESSKPEWPFIAASTMTPRIMKSVNVKVVVDISNVEGSIKSEAIPVLEMIKPAVKPYIMPYIFKDEINDGKTILIRPDSVEAIIEIIPKIYKINAVIIEPTSTIFLAGIPIPRTMPFSQLIVPTGVDLTSLPTFPLITSLTKVPRTIASTIYETCKVTAKNVTTLDTITLDLPEIDTSCEVVLAHDCSPQKLYTVVSSPVTESGTRSVKVIVPHFKVEVAQGLVHQGVVVKVNGAITSIPTTRPLIISRPIAGIEVPVLNITFSGIKCIITAPEVGLSVVTNGTVIKVKVSPLLRSTACGLCNHIPTVPVSSGSSVIPTITGTYSIIPKLPKYIIKSTECPTPRIRTY